MDCQEFRDKHFTFVDDTLPGIELVRMQLHIGECQICARQDTRVRRALMLFRSLPPIEPSAGFAERLECRLHEAKMAEAAPGSGSSRIFAAAVATVSVVMLGYIGTSLRQVDTQRDIALPPVVATLPESATEAVVSPAPAMVASVPAGLPIWTAALFAEQAQAHFVSADLRLTESNR
ncbi:MAG: hypothetical protein WKF55_11075 [Gemmatimonadaceae bacterium]